VPVLRAREIDRWASTPDYQSLLTSRPLATSGVAGKDNGAGESGANKSTSGDSAGRKVAAGKSGGWRNW